MVTLGVTSLLPVSSSYLLPAVPQPHVSATVTRSCLSPGVSPECPQGVPAVFPAAMEPRELLEALVVPVAIVGKLVATVTKPRRRVWPLLYPESLHADLRRFIWRLRDTLDHGDVTSLRQRGVTPLGQALATLKAAPEVTWADVRATVRTWRELMFLFEDRWAWLSWEARRLCDTLEEKAITEAIAKVTTEDPDEATTTGPGREEAMVATSQQGVATSREQRVGEALELLEHLEVACKKAIVFLWKLLHQLWYIEAIQEGTEEASPNVPEALAATVAKAELLWEASAHLTRSHLLVTLGEIDFLLSSPYGGSGGPDGPRGRAVAERCQRAIEDIPRLLEDSDVTIMSSRQ
ncbi:uncharacterized protein FYW23_014611 [Sylvia borin]